jgi:hypothetical protein
LLTQEELAAARDPSVDPRSQTRDYINIWITNELLYQEAVQRGMADSDELRRQLELARRHLAIEALLDAEIYRSDTTVSEDEIASIYKTAGEAFRLREDVVNVSFVMFADRDQANAFRSKVIQSIPWENAIRQVQNDSLLRSQLVRVVSRQYFTQANLYPEELWKLSRALTKGEISFVVNTDAGHCVLMVHSYKKQGEMPDLEYMRNEIRERILIDERKLKYDRLVASLRAKHTVEVPINLNDTTAAVQE